MGITLIALLGVGLVAGWMSIRTEQILIGSHKQATHELASRLPQDAEMFAYSNVSAQEAVQRAINVRSFPDVSLVVTDGTGNILIRPEVDWFEQQVVQELLQQYAAKASPSVVVLGESHYVVCAQPLVLQGQQLGDLFIALDITDDQQMFAQLMRTLLVVTLVTMGLMAIIIAVYVVRSLRPLREMNQKTAALSVSELAHYQVEMRHAPTEVRQLAATCEQVFVQLASTLERQQQFIRDISHELRTPLSIVSGYLQSMLRRSKTLTEPQRDALETAVAEADHTIQLLQNLLDLERAGSGHTAFKQSPVIVDEVVDDVVRMAITSSYRDIDIDMQVPRPIEAVADPDQLKRVLAQLVDNAIKYSDSDDPVTVRLNQTNGRAIIQVCDRGVGIPLQHQSRIFDQCYRVDSSRSRSTGGCGIGLSLVKVARGRHGRDSYRPL